MMYLRPYRDPDLSTIHSWIDSEQTLRIWSGPRHPVFPFPAEELAAVYEGYRKDLVNFPMVGWDEQGLAGAVTLRYTAPRTLRLVNVITDHTRRGQGIGREFVGAALKMCFELMDAETVSLGVLAENERAVRCYLAAGFTPLPEETWITHTFCGRNWLCMEMVISREAYFDRKKADG